MAASGSSPPTVLSSVRVFHEASAHGTLDPPGIVRRARPLPRGAAFAGGWAIAILFGLSDTAAHIVQVVLFLIGVAVPSLGVGLAWLVLRGAGGQPSALFLLDRELGARAA